MTDFLGGTSIKGTTATGIKESLGAALGVAGNLAKTAPDAAAALTRAANSAFVDGMQIGILVAAGATLLGAIIVFVWLPARAARRGRRDAGRRARREPGERPRAGAGAGTGVPRRAGGGVTMTATADPEARRPGRPRSTEADEAILEAAVDLFAECGFDGLTVEGVAARANVGKATIYRRYPCKVDLVIAASRCFALDDETWRPIPATLAATCACWSTG